MNPYNLSVLHLYNIWDCVLYGSTYIFLQKVAFFVFFICQFFRHCFAPATFFPNTNIKQLKWIPPPRWKLVVKWTQLELKKLRCRLKKLKLKLNECSRGARAARAPELNNRSQTSRFQWTVSLGSTRPRICWVEPSLQVLECVFKRVFFMKY